MDFEKAYNDLKVVLAAFKVDAEKHDAEHAAQITDLRGRVELLREDNKRLTAEKDALQQRISALDEKYIAVLRENIELFNEKIARENGLEEELRAVSEKRHILGYQGHHFYVYLHHAPTADSASVHTTTDRRSARRMDAEEVEAALRRLDEIEPHHKFCILSLQ
jgi:tetrahydromethanopterin S-methyltransferase subunit G